MGDHASRARPARIDAAGHASVVPIYEDDLDWELEHAATQPPNPPAAYEPFSEVPMHPAYAGRPVPRWDDGDYDEYAAPMALPPQRATGRPQTPYREEEYAEDMESAGERDEREAPRHDQSRQRWRIFPRR
jgi:hypothetical protein